MHLGRLIDHGAPRKRADHPDCDAPFVLDPAGTTLEAVFHGEARRSAPSGTLTAVDG